MRATVMETHKNFYRIYNANREQQHSLLGLVFQTTTHIASLWPSYSSAHFAAHHETSTSNVP